MIFTRILKRLACAGRFYLIPDGRYGTKTVSCGRMFAVVVCFFTFSTKGGVMDQKVRRGRMKETLNMPLRIAVIIVILTWFFK